MAMVMPMSPLMVLLVSAFQAEPGPSAKPPPSVPEGPEQDASTPLSVKLAAGGRLRNITGVSVHAWELELALGQRLDEYALYGVPEVSFGRTAAGLAVLTVRALCLFEVPFEPFWLGVDFGFGWVTVQRKTRPDQMSTVSAGLGLAAELDLFRIGPGAIYLGTRAGVDLLGQAHERVGSYDYGLYISTAATLSLGFRN
jgi:hypothetical protein